MADLPAAVTVGPYRLTVCADQAAIDRAGQVAGANLLGQHDMRSGSIALAPDLASDIEAETLLHEVLHALFDATGVGGGEGEETLLERDAEERLIRQCSPMLLDLLRRNPDLLAYLTSG